MAGWRLRSADGPSLAIIIPCLNEAAALDDQLRALQGLPDVRIVFVDGGSDDDTVARIRQAGFECIEHAPGRATQMNAGAALCREADVLCFLHADTMLTAEHLADIRDVMGEPAIAGGRFDVRLSGSSMAFRLIERLMNWRSRLTRISTGDQAMFVRRKMFEWLGGFPEQPLMEDIELSRRLKRVGKIACLPRPVVTSGRRWERHGIGRTVLLMWKLRLYYRLGVPVEKLAAMYDHAR